MDGKREGGMEGQRGVGKEGEINKGKRERNVCTNFLVPVWGLFGQLVWSYDQLPVTAVHHSAGQLGVDISLPICGPQMNHKLRSTNIV